MTQVVLAYWLPLGLVAAYATLRGGGPEKCAAIMLVAALILTALVRPAGAHRFASVQRSVLLVDLTLLAGLVWLAIRADRTWTVFLAAFHGLTLLGHLGRAENPDLWQLGYYLMTNLPFYPGLAALMIGTVAHQRRLQRSRIDPSWKT
jgi:hypothetical protein